MKLRCLRAQSAVEVDRNYRLSAVGGLNLSAVGGLLYLSRGVLERRSIDENSAETIDLRRNLIRVLAFELSLLT